MYKDLNAQNRRMEYWWRRNKDGVLATLLVVVFLLGFWILPALGFYMVS
jgi:hypothetical protein